MQKNCWIVFCLLRSELAVLITSYLHLHWFYGAGLEPRLHHVFLDELVSIYVVDGNTQ